MDNFNNLNVLIAEKTRSIKYPEKKNISRFFYLPTSANFEQIESWYKLWFPNNSLLDDIYSWLSFSDDQTIKQKLQQSWQRSMSVNTLTNLINSGYLINENLLNIVFLIDLTEAESYKRLTQVYDEFKVIVEKWGAPTQVFYTAIVLLRNYDDSNSQMLEPKYLDEFKEWSRENLNRLYYLDITNHNGIFISSSIDMNFLIGQLIYYLTQKPNELEISKSENNYCEWINRIDPKKDFANSFSAMSVVIPIDYILQLCLVSRGAELIEHALFSEPSDKARSNYYSNLLLNKFDLNSYLSLKDLLFEQGKKSKFIDPIDLIKQYLNNISDKPYKKQIEYKLQIYEQVFSELPEIIQNNNEVLLKLVPEITGNFKYQLLDINDQLIVSEVGAESVYFSFIDILRNKIIGIKPDNFSEKEQVDIKIIFNKIKREKERIAANEALAARSLIFVVLLSVLVFSFIKSSSIILSVSAGIFLISIGAMIFDILATRSRINRYFLMVESQISSEWQAASHKTFSEIIELLKTGFIANIDENKSQLSKVFDRFRFIVDFGKNKYDAPKPIESAFWINLIKTRNEALNFASKIKKQLVFKPLINLFNTSSSLELWNRISYTNTDKLNDWELGLLEKAAIELVPDSKDLISSSVCETLTNHNDKLDNIKLLLSKYCEPFTQVNPLEIPEKHGVLEIPNESCFDVKESLSRSISEEFKLSFKDSKTPYRISFFGFAEGIDFTKVVSKLKN